MFRRLTIWMQRPKPKFRKSFLIVNLAKLCAPVYVQDNINTHYFEFIFLLF
jgi:hypothetical protein